MEKKKKIKITLVRSKYGRKPNHRECVHGLGLQRLNQSIEVEDTPAVRGMINKIEYLLKIEER